MNTCKFINVIKEELVSGFFQALSLKCNISLETVEKCWDEYFECQVAVLPGAEAPSTGKKSLKTPEVFSEVDRNGDELSRQQQTPIIFSSIDKMKVADLRSLNKERGLSRTGNKASLMEVLKEYETRMGQVVCEEADPVKPKKREIGIEKNKSPKGKKQQARLPTSTPQIHVVAEIDEYNNKVIDGDLVCDDCDSDDTDTLVVVGYLCNGHVQELDLAHIERCRELKVKFRMPESFDVPDHM